MKEQIPSIQIIGKVSHRLAEITSTNSFAKQLIAKDEPVHGTVIMADYQTGGRGQIGKQWVSASGKNLLCSVILKPESKIEHQYYLNKMVAVAIAETIQEQINQNVYIKWPNDILIDNEKICGVLIENIIQAKHLAYVIIGIGFNVNQVIFDEQLNATSLQRISGIHYDLQKVSSLLFSKLDQWFVKFSGQQFQKIDDAYHERLYKWNQSQTFLEQGVEFQAVIEGVNQQGLLVLNIGGKRRLVRNQEVEFVL